MSRNETSQEAVARFFAHDLRGPLGPMVLAMSALADRPEIDGASRELALMALAQADRMTRLIQSAMWALREPDTSDGPIDLAATLREAAASVAALGATCETHIDGEMLVRGDAVRVRDALAGIVEVVAGAHARARVDAHMEADRGLVLISGQREMADPHPGPPADAESALLGGARALLSACGGGMAVSGTEVTVWLPAA